MKPTVPAQSNPLSKEFTMNRNLISIAIAAAASSSGSKACGRSCIASSSSKRYLLQRAAAVGVVMYWPHIRSHALAVGVALVVSVVATMAVTALVLRAIAKDEAE